MTQSSRRRSTRTTRSTPTRGGRARVSRRSSGRPAPRTHRGRRPPTKPKESALDELAASVEPRRLPGAATAVGAEGTALHIVMVGWEFPPNISGGLGVHSYEIVRELTRLGHRITFLSPFSGPFTPVPGVKFRFPGETHPGEPAPEFPPAYWTGASAESPFVDAIDGYNVWMTKIRGVEDADLVHVHDWFGTIGATQLAHRLSVPLVMTVHSTEYDRSLDHPWQHILDREQAGIDAAIRVIAVSAHLRRQLIDRYRADPDKVVVVYNAVRPTERLERIDPTRRVVLYVGRLAVMKGVDTFVRAAARVVTVVPDALFVVAGEGPEYPHLVRLAAELGIGDHVMFLGKVSEEEREVLLRGSSVFVLPSVVEPFGIAALEAMAAGVPTIISKTSGVAEISSGTFRVDFWDVEEFASRIAELLEYPTLRRSMGEQGRWEALREGWPERARETVVVYRDAIRAYR